MRLNKGAFKGCSGLTSVTIPDSVTSIGYYTFYSCSGLTSVTIPDSVTSIGERAFSGCNNIIRKSKGICYIDKWVVGVVNNSLSTAEIENTTRGIAGSSFSSCSGLKNIYITDLAAWCKISGLNNLMAYGSNEKNLYLNGELVTNLTIPHGVTSIGTSAFNSCSGLTNVTIPDSVTSIGNYAFRNCSGLTSVIIGNGVTSIEESAFIDCSGLRTVFYKGTAEQWKQISMDSYNYGLSTMCYYYSETEPSLNADGTAYNGNYWHYDSDGKTPLIWKKETIG